MAAAERAWGEFTAAACEDFSLAELHALSLPTLQALLPHYGVTGPASAALVEEHWHRLHRGAGPLEHPRSATPEGASARCSAQGAPLLSPYRGAALEASTDPSAGGACDPCLFAPPVTCPGEVTVMKPPGQGLGLVFHRDSLLLTDCVAGAAPAPALQRCVGWYLTHCDGVPVATQAEVNARATPAAVVALRFAARPSAAVLVSPPPPPSVGGANRRESPPRDGRSAAEPLQSPRPKPPAAGAPPPPPQHSAAPLVSPQRCALLDTQQAAPSPRPGRPQRRLRCAPSEYPVRHNEPFEVPKPERAKSLSRRRRLAADYTAQSDPNTAAAARHGRGKQGRSAAAAAGHAGTFSFGGTASPPRSPQGRALTRFSPSAGRWRDPILNTAGDAEDVAAPAGTRRRRVPAPEAADEPAAAGNRKRRHGDCPGGETAPDRDPSLRPFTPGRRRGPPQGGAAGSDPNIDPGQGPAAGRSRAAPPTDHGPPGVWPNGGLPLRGNGVRLRPAPDGASPFALDPGGINECSGGPGQRRGLCVSPQALQQRESSIEPVESVLVGSQPGGRGGLTFIGALDTREEAFQRPRRSRSAGSKWVQAAQRDHRSTLRHVGPAHA
eukprot:TRINITY_DN70264_c0_g1_i1.p1 TRINITY_DN70264_c0_g1~~TRINITY_DN70264_c0_g1_i1.p1  ORF type:complete len:632 (+),score=166.04 TRINITY_DN70264_c0_g1_i1:74-1897(+)